MPSADVPSAAVVRRATTADLPHIGRLATLLIQAHHDFDSRRFLAPDGRTPAAYASFLSRQLEDTDAVLLVAEENAEVIGYTYAALEGYDYMSLRGPAGILHDIVVDPESRGRGIGRLLVRATLAHLKSRGAPRVVLSTAERNESAQRFFTTLGFRRTMIEMTRELDDFPT